MIARYRGGTIPEARNAFGDDAYDGLRASAEAKLDVYDTTGALDEIWEHVRALNKYVTEQKPWELAKVEDRAAGLDTVLYTLADGLRVVAVALSAFLPETAPQILDALRQPRDLAWDGVAANRTALASGVEAAAPLYPRVETTTAA